MRTFNTDLELGGEAEELIYHTILEPRGFVKTPIEYWFDKYNVTTTKELYEECDFVHSTNERYGIELKSLAGGYSTFCIEKWSDDLYQHKPGWMKSTESGLLKKIIIYNREENTAYFYNPRLLLECVQSYPNTLLVRAGNGNLHDSGWLAKLSWEDKEIGFITKVSLHNR
jgi:hypothetical protein